MILTTGTTGTIGKEVVKELASRGVKVRALVRRQSDADALKSLRVEAVIGDFAQRESLRSALRSVERVFLLSPTTPSQVAHEKNVIEEAKLVGVQHIVKLSILGAHCASACTLLKWHGQAEQIVEASGIDYTFLRPNTLMQNIVPFYAQSIAQESVFYAPGGDALMSFVDTRDIAAMAATVLTENGHEGRTYEITGPEACSYTRIAEKLSDILRRRISFINVADAAAKQSMVAAGIPEWFAHALVTLYHFYRQNGGRLVAGTVEMLTGQRPRTIDAYLQENIQAFQA